MTFHGHSQIAGQLVVGTDATFTVTSPLDSTVLPGVFHEASAAEVDAALTAAQDAFAITRESEGETRARLLETIAAEIMSLGESLLERARLETGLTMVRLESERARTIGQLELFAAAARANDWLEAVIEPGDPQRTPMPKPDLRRMMVPIGPVVVFGSSNFPFAYSVAGGDTASALATGNPVIVKAHEAHPGTSELVAGAIARALEKCALPAGMFSMLQGFGRNIGPLLAKHPLTRAIGFTGSQVAGRALFDAAAARPDPIPVFAEMSSLNPIVVLPGALAEHNAAIANTIANSITTGAGQFCTKPGVLLVQEDPSLARFRDALAEKLSHAEPLTMLHRGIAQNFIKGCEHMQRQHATREIARASKPADATATQGAPLLLETRAGDFIANPALRHEVFGPFSLMVIAKDAEEIAATLQALDGQLTASLFASDEEMTTLPKLIELMRHKAGRLIFNGVPTGLEVNRATHHGGPWPATSDARFTSMGNAAIARFVRPVVYQNCPDCALPPALQNENPLKIPRMIDGHLTQAPIE